MTSTPYDDRPEVEKLFGPPRVLFERLVQLRDVRDKMTQPHYQELIENEIERAEARFLELTGTSFQDLIS